MLRAFLIFLFLAVPVAAEEVVAFDERCRVVIDQLQVMGLWSSDRIGIDC